MILQTCLFFSITFALRLLQSSHLSFFVADLNRNGSVLKKRPENNKVILYAAITVVGLFSYFGNMNLKEEVALNNAGSCTVNLSEDYSPATYFYMEDIDSEDFLKKKCFVILKFNPNVIKETVQINKSYSLFEDLFSTPGLIMHNLPPPVG